MPECEKLKGRLREICRGESGLSAAVEATYLRRAFERGEIGEEPVQAAEARAAVEATEHPERVAESRRTRRRCAEQRVRHKGADCVHRGSWVNEHYCPSCCGGKTTVPTFGCKLRIDGKLAHRVCADRAGVEGVQDCGVCDHFQRKVEDIPGVGFYAAPSYMTTEQLVADTTGLVGRIPPDVSAVVGVARSGMLPASVLATLLHRPLLAMTSDAVVDCGHGWRLSGDSGPAVGTALIVDDTVGSGHSLRRAREIAAKHFPKRLHLHVYVNPDADDRPDLFAAWLPIPHILEWNLFNSVYLEWSAYDFDGILCRDFTHEEDDDGERYMAALESMPPLRLPRKMPLHIVTARLEKYRVPTESWLSKWGITAASLTMGPWASKAERERDDVAGWKAGHVGRLLGRMRPPRAFGGPLFVESDPGQAERIAALSGHAVVCPAARRVYRSGA